MAHLQLSHCYVSHVSYLEGLLAETYSHHSTAHKDCSHYQHRPAAVTRPYDTIQAPAPAPDRTETRLRPHPTAWPQDSQRSQDLTTALTIIPYNPTKGPRNRGRNIWMGQARKLISTTPSGSEWWKTIQDCGLDQVMHKGAAAQFVLDSSPLSSFDSTCALPLVSENHTPEEQALIHATERYAHLAASRQLSVQCALSLVYLQKLVLLGACFVLHEMGISKAPLIRVTQICFGNITEEYALQLWRVGAFVNQLTDSLALAGWGGRASDLYLIWNQSPQSFYPLVKDYAEALEYLTTQLSSKCYTQNVVPREGWAPLFIPYLIWRMLGERVHIARISHHLGYKHPEVLNPELGEAAINPWRYFRL